MANQARRLQKYRQLAPAKSTWAAPNGDTKLALEERQWKEAKMRSAYRDIETKTV